LREGIRRPHPATVFLGDLGDGSQKRPAHNLDRREATRRFRPEQTEGGKQIAKIKMNLGGVKPRDKPPYLFQNKGFWTSNITQKGKDLGFEEYNEGRTTSFFLFGFSFFKPTHNKTRDQTVEDEGVPPIECWRKEPSTSCFLPMHGNARLSKSGFKRAV